MQRTGDQGIGGRKQGVEVAENEKMKGLASHPPYSAPSPSSAPSETYATSATFY